MYLVYLQLCDDSIPAKGGFNKIVKLEKLQGVDIQAIKPSVDKRARDQVYAVTYIPEKGASFEVHYNYCTHLDALHCDDVVASAIFYDERSALMAVDIFDAVSCQDGFSQLNDSICNMDAYFVFIACHNT